ncbi:MAG TPA: MFS transporter, partial [Armatimonadota bacterium]|nr:MFS transporter [Armatimonadota bacterium]
MRHSMPAVLVKKDNLMNAIALNSAAFNSARIIGPAVAGLLVANFSMALCFYLNAASYLAVIIALLLIKTRTPAKPKSGASVFIDIADGLRYIKQEKRILNLMLVLAVSSLFVMPYVTLIPVFAKDILKMGIEANAKLLTSIGIGAVVGSLLLAGLSHLPGRARILIISSAIGGVMLIAFANSEHLLLSQIILIGLGFSVVSFNQTTNTLIQGVTDDAYRGRVMSVYVFTFMGLSPLANLQAGVLAHTLGAPLTVTLWGFIFLSLSVFILLKLPVFNYEKCNH